MSRWQHYKGPSDDKTSLGYPFPAKLDDAGYYYDRAVRIGKISACPTPEVRRTVTLLVIINKLSTYIPPPLESDKLQVSALIFLI